jgi:formylglycine-generating enzyme required for sulfatase activity
VGIRLQEKIMNLKYIHYYGRTFLVILVLLSLGRCSLPSDNDQEEETYYHFPFSGSYNFIKVPVPNNGIDFPIGINDDDTTKIESAFYIGETLVTIALWDTVSRWANEREYGYYYGLPTYQTTTNEKTSWDQPITDPAGTGYNSTWDYNAKISMYYVVPIWLNAFTEWQNEKYGTNLVPVYQDEHGNPIRSINNMDNILETADTNANGFRLPTSDEWELAARWNGSSKINTVTKTINGIDFSNQAINFTTGRSASGARGQVDNFAENDRVAVWKNNSGVRMAVKNKEPNMLGIYDMSGNCLELTSNWKYGRIGSTDWWSAQCRGGSASSDYEDIAIGKLIWANYNRGSFGGIVETGNVGIRVAQNAE